MKAKEIREMDSQKILKNINELKEELFNLRFQSSTSSLENPKRGKNIKKDIARMKTVLRERELQDKLNSREG